MSTDVLFLHMNNQDFLLCVTVKTALAHCRFLNEWQTAVQSQRNCINHQWKGIAMRRILRWLLRADPIWRQPLPKRTPGQPKKSLLPLKIATLLFRIQLPFHINTKGQTQVSAWMLVFYLPMHKENYFRKLITIKKSNRQRPNSIREGDSLKNYFHSTYPFNSPHCNNCTISQAINHPDWI